MTSLARNKEKWTEKKCCGEEVEVWMSEREREWTKMAFKRFVDGSKNRHGFDRGPNVERNAATANCGPLTEGRLGTGAKRLCERIVEYRSVIWQKRSKTESTLRKQHTSNKQSARYLARNDILISTYGGITQMPCIFRTISLRVLSLLRLHRRCCRRRRHRLDVLFFLLTFFQFHICFIFNSKHFVQLRMRTT